jgi:putative transposase
LLVDTEGLLLAVQVTAANVQDHHQVDGLVAAGKQRSPRLQRVWVDEGYQGNEVAEQIQTDFHIALTIVPKPAGSKGFTLVPRRWVVERTFAWLGRYRRLSKDYEYLCQTSETMIVLAMTHLMLKRLARAG